jgi:hypothetical protein
MQKIRGKHGFVFKSINTTWPKWAFVPNVGTTQWFDSRLEAEKAMHASVPKRLAGKEIAK